MNDITPVYSDAVLALMACPDETVPARMIAPIVGMHPSVIIAQAKAGEWDREHNGNFIVSGKRVKFYKIDFLKKGGWL